MRALRFKIKLDCLELLDWNEWKRADQERILEAGKKNHLIPHEARDNRSITFTGDIEKLYWFMHDVAYNYDIELI